MDISKHQIERWKLLHDLGIGLGMILMNVNDKGDVAEFGSTNDLDLLRDLRKAYDEYRIATNDMGPEEDDD